MPRLRNWSAAFSCGLLVLAMGGAANAADATAIDWTPWAELPVRPAFESKARVMPLDTLARQIVETICGKEYFKFDLAANLTKDELASLAMQPARSLFPGDKPRTFRASPLLLSWLLEREKWDEVPFLRCAHEDLRKLLGVSIKNELGEFILFVSPRQVRESDGYHQHRQDLAEKQAAARDENQEFHFVGVDEKFNELFQAVSLWEQLDLQGMLDPDAARAFVTELELARSTWSRVEPKLQFGVNTEAGEANPLAEIQTQVEAARQALAKCYELLEARDIRFLSIEPVAAQFARSTAELAEVFAGLDERARQQAAGSQAGAPDDKARAALAQLAWDSGQLRDVGEQLLGAVYRNTELLRVVPALNAAALEKDREQNDRSQPWLDLRTVLFATGLRQVGDYPEAQLAGVRSSFATLQRIYPERDSRPNDFNGALAGFSAALRGLGEEITARIDRLALQGRDEEVIQAVSYPKLGATHIEALYNRVNPFAFVWGILLLATLLLGMYVGMVRWKWLFSFGMLVLFAGLGWSIYGFWMRVQITGWAPVTNMYETVIYVATLVPALGLWFALLPATWPGIKRAWPMTAWPFALRRRDAAPTEPVGRPSADRDDVDSTATARWLLLLPRLALAALIFWLLALAPYADGGRTAFGLSPNIDIGKNWPDFNDIVTWIVGLIVLGVSVWLGPRVLLTAVLSLWTVPASLRSQLATAGIAVRARWPFALMGAGVGFILSLVAWYTPVLDKDFSPLQPVLRSQFWLLIHVLTIVASYAAGALAWGLGTITLGIYLFGTYREPALARVAIGGHRPAGGGGGMLGGGPGGDLQPQMPKRPPEITAEFASFVYKAIQVAVVLLAAGTILGGVWADRAWGRFWGWDPKEVWALISLLVYLAILHGRYAGWFGNFGLCVGSVLGASAIAFSWYGVNFVLGVGLHSYGFGTGGQYEVGGVVLLSWAFMAAATVRYRRETHGSDPTSDEE
ncbi:MAG: cytochrome c biogenesis protein CcsA [Pirellulales bacterium]|nr:cytochrome c biogenesis protein CcsA [Pirellulales bacterium]